MGKRRDPRVQARLQVRVAGIDANGRPLLQTAVTRDISRQGALLDGIRGTFKLGEIISVSYNNDKARFRVAWIGEAGTDRAGQLGVQSVDPAKCIWDSPTLPPPVADTYVPQPKERRRHQRVPCKLGAELYLRGSDALVRVRVTDISIGGCFAEMPTLPPDNSRLKIVVWVNKTKLVIQGVVVNRRPGFGISIKFTDITEDVRPQLEGFVQSLLLVHTI
jgi:PilZ domain